MRQCHHVIEVQVAELETQGCDVALRSVDALGDIVHAWDRDLRVSHVQRHRGRSFGNDKSGQLF